MFSQTPISLPNTSWKNTSQTPYSRLIDAQGLLAGTTFLFVLFCWWVSSAEPSGLRGPGIPSEKTHLRLWLASPGLAAVEGWESKDTKIEALIGTSQVWSPCFRTLRLALLGFGYGCNSTLTLSWTILKQLHVPPYGAIHNQACLF